MPTPCRASNPPAPAAGQISVKRPACGVVAQLGERRSCTAEVRGSNPLNSTLPGYAWPGESTGLLETFEALREVDPALRRLGAI